MSQPPAKRAKLDLSQEIAVLVGPDEKRYMCHGGVLSRHSKFFRAALSNSRYKEAQGKVVKLPEVDPELFEPYIQWSYSEKIVLMEQEEENCDDEGNLCDLLADFYVVADKLGDTLLRNAIMDTMTKTFSKLDLAPGLGEITSAYEHTPENSKLRQYVIDWQVGWAYGDEGCKWMQDHRNDLPRDYLTDALIGYIKYAENRDDAVDPKTASCCHYHDHDEDVPPCESNGAK